MEPKDAKIIPKRPYTPKWNPKCTQGRQNGTLRRQMEPKDAKMEPIDTKMEPKDAKIESKDSKMEPKDTKIEPKDALGGGDGVALGGPGWFLVISWRFSK